MESSITTDPAGNTAASHQEAWEMVRHQLRQELSKAQFENWVLPMQPLESGQGVFRLSTPNPYGRDWVQSHLKGQITRLLKGLLNPDVVLEVLGQGSQPQKTGLSVDDLNGGIEPGETKERGGNSKRKIMLQRAYGSQRARIIQPERGMFITQYFFNQWLPLLGASAANTILAARSLCYWNPLTGELRNLVETEMGDLAERAAVSVRTIKDVLNNELVKRYFLRYKVRRVMTPNGVRTAGISLEVRMDDPLTPSDQQTNNLSENEEWYTLDIED